MHKKVTDKHIKRVKELANEDLYFSEVTKLYNKAYPERELSETTIRKIIITNNFPHKKRRKGPLEGVEKYAHEEKSIQQILDEYNKDHPEKKANYQRMRDYIIKNKLPNKNGALITEDVEEPFSVVEKKILKAKQKLKKGKIKPTSSVYYKRRETK